MSSKDDRYAHITEEEWENITRDANQPAEDKVGSTYLPTNQHYPSTNLPTNLPTNPHSTRGRATYPWKQWTDGKRHEITRGRDFNVSPHIMVTQLHNRARILDLVVDTNTTGGTISFRFFRSHDEKRILLLQESMELETKYADTNPHLELDL